MAISKKRRRLLARDVDRLHAKDPAYDNASTVDAIKLLIFALIFALACRVFVFDIIRIDGPSMEPTFFDADRVFAEKVSYHFRAPRRGEVVIAHYPPQVEKESVIKRVVALPGETVYILNGRVYINDRPLDESEYWGGEIYGDIAPITIPEKHVLLVGDNRNQSLDSRDVRVGPVPYYRVMARVLLQVWPLSQWRAFGEVAY